MGYEMYFLRLVRNFLIISLCASYGKADVISDLYDALHMDRINEIIRLEGIQDAEGTGEAYLPPNSVDRLWLKQNLFINWRRWKEISSVS